MGVWHIVTPEELRNKVANPSVERATTGFTAVGGSIARSAAQQRRGVWSLAVTPTAGTTDGAYFGTVSLTNGTAYTFSVDFKGVLGVSYKIWFADTSGNLLGTAYTFTATGFWQRVQVTYTEVSTTTRRVYMTKASGTSTGVFYVDGLMVAAQTTAADVHTYVDGDQGGCIWVGAAHASESVRSGQYRRGGKLAEIDAMGVTVLAHMGMGMPPGKHLTQSQVFLAGEKFEGRKVMPRTIDLRIKADGQSTDSTRAWEALHSIRQNLIEAIQPDLVSGEEGDDQPYVLRYSGADADRPVFIECVYDTGLELQETKYTYEQINLRSIAYMPYWYEDGTAGCELTLYQTLTGANYIIGKVDNTWSKLSTGMNGAVYALVVGPDGSIYAGGAFTTAGGTTVNYVAKWDGAAWSALGSGFNGVVYALAVGPDGSLYAGGAFTASGATTVNRIAKWNGSAWSALAAVGFDADVYALAFGRDGSLYVGGAFTLIGFMSYSYRIARWDGAVWYNVGDGFDDDVNTIAVGIDGKIYVGGEFIQNNSATVTFNCVAVWNGSAWSTLGTGMSGGGPEVNALAVGKNGVLYAGGNFTSVDGVTASYIAAWNGAGWAAMGTEIDGIVYDIYIDQISGLVKVGSTVGWMLWNGVTWVYMDTAMPGSADAYCNRGNDIYIGGRTTGDVMTGYLNTMTNTGSAKAYPVIKIKRSGGTQLWLKYLKNETTGAVLYFNYYLLDGETLTIDLRPGKRMIESDFFGTVWNALERGSELAKFYLQKGSNEVMAWATPAGSPTVTATMEWAVQHWAADMAAV